MRLFAIIGSFVFILTHSGRSAAYRTDVQRDRSGGSLRTESRSDSRGELRIMWYNVENLFHPDDDTLAGDDDFTPDGARHWTPARYQKKLTAIAKVIVAAGAWEPPEVVGLCEVENARILRELVEHPILAPYGYLYVHQESPDRRGMDVACLYRGMRIRLCSWKAFTFATDAEQGSTRDIMHFCGAWGSRDTLDLFMVHLISKYSGAGATAEARKKQLVQLLHLADSMHHQREESLQVMLGDFNEEKEGYSMEPVRKARIGNDSIWNIDLAGRFGSYKYRGQWSRIDQFLVCGQFQSYTLKGSIMEHPLLLTRDETYGGMKPMRTYVGYLYCGGISDHLPILLDITGPLSSTHSAP